MTTTYDITTNVGKVRLTISDTDTSTAVFTDEELGYFLTYQSDNILLASAQALEAWAAKYGASPSNEKIGDYSYQQKVVANMLTLAKRLKDKVNEAPYMTWAEMNLTAGSAITAEED